MDKRGFLFLTVVLFFSAVFSFTAEPAHAQEPTTQPTTVYEYRVDLASNNAMVIERRITYGEIAIVLVIGALALVYVLNAIFRAVQLWLR